MKILFFLFVVSFYIGLNGYVFYRGLQTLPSSITVKIIYSILFWLFTLSFFVRMFSGDRLPQGFSITLSVIAFTWMVAVIYFALIILGIDILRIINHFTALFPAFIRENYQLVKYITGAASVVFVTGLLVYGNIRFNNPEVTRLELKIGKPVPGDELKLVMISDIHLSNYITGDDLDKYIEMINRENPNLVLIAGDIADMRLEPLKKWGVAERFAKIKAPMGVYAISGNHEFYGGEKEQILDYLKEGGVNILLDSVAVTGGVVQIAGRDDRTNHKRKSLKEVLKDTDKSLPLILLDHQPFNLPEAENEGVDLQLSGHTHNGQFWPGSLIVKWMYELPYGYKRRGDTHYYVSSGIGLWGPRMRIGTKSEIVSITLKK
ncbi:MAG: metallophosphoesterase [Bacteroidales bacterium]